MVSTPGRVSVVEVRRDDPFKTVRIVEEELLGPTADGVQVEIERFGIATNNLAYALLGDVLGHWAAFPAEPGWGRPPVWGTGRVVAGDPELLPLGTKVSGYLPMATLTSVRAVPTKSGIMATDAGRSSMLPLYRRLTVVPDDPEILGRHADVSTVLLPVVPFAGVLAADLVDSGATRVVISSASSRSAAGLARLLLQAGVETTGLTSDHHRDAVKAMAAYARVLTYGEIASDLLPGADVVFVDVAGSPDITSAVHHRLGNRLTSSIAVGGTHVRQLPDQRPAVRLPGPEPQRFSVGDRELEIADESGLDTVVDLERRAQAQLVPWAASWLQVSELQGLASAKPLWQQIAKGGTDPLAAAIINP